MKTKYKILGLLLCIIISLGVFKATTYVYQKKIDKAELIIRKERIKNDSLVKIGEGFYTKLVADTLTIKNLKELNDILELKVKNPKIITQIEFKPIEIEKPIDKVVMKDSILTINDSYPDSINTFVRYFATINIKTKENLGKFSFENINIDLGIGQNKDGTYFINTKLPEYFEVTSIDIQALPLETPKIDNFGLLLGAGYGHSYLYNSNFVYVEAGIRINKTYLEIGGTTNQTIYAGLKFEF